MHKVALLVFNPFTNDSRVRKEAQSLSRYGYSVEIIAHLDKNLKKIQKCKNFTIKRFSYLNRRVTKNTFKKLLAYLIYLYKSIIYCKEFDILHCNDLNTLPVGVIVKKVFNKNIKIVYDAHEYETEVNGLKGIRKSIVKKLEKQLIRHVDTVITVSNSIAEEYVNLYNIQKPKVVLNTPKYTNIKKRNLFREKFNINHNQTIYLYQGSLNHGRGIETVIETFKNMNRNTNILVVMGYGPMEKEIIEISHQYASIHFHPAVTSDVLLEYTSSADFGISTIEDTCLSYRYCLPNKMFEYIMAEVPVIVSYLPEMKKIVTKYKVGMIAHENTTEGLKNAILKSKELNKKELHLNLIKAKNIFKWEAQEKVLISTYKVLHA